MLPRSVEPFPKQPLELSERSRFGSSQHFDILQREFEGSRFEADITRRIREHETKVDVDEMPVTVEEDVTVVSVFDLQEVGD